ncbi:MAG: cupin-like domain-containing protein [Parvularculaceae bacterium]|nr:cupin-like domain-containing protein [Parvularculaceae bacterium]
MTIFSDPGAALAERYPGAAARLTHRLAEDPRFTLEALAALAARLGRASIEYNAGDLPVGQDPALTPANGLSPEETIRRIKTCGSWMVLKNVEADPGYREVMDACLAEIAPVAAIETGPMAKKIAFIFISSPGAVTPFHMDPEHNILMQLRGVKTMHVFPTDAGIVSDEQHEAYHAGAAHRNLTHRPEFDALAEKHDLHAGDALYVPVKAPHWVANGPAPSVSFSITWRSRLSLDEASLRLANGWIRARGLQPPTPGARPLRDRLAVYAHRAASKFARR